MHALRTARSLARIFLAVFVLALGAAGMAPAMQAGADVICTAPGVAKSSPDGDTGSARLGHTLDCALCLPGGPPPAPVIAQAVPAQALAHVLLPAVAAHIASVTAAALPARGPPALS